MKQFFVVVLLSAVFLSIGAGAEEPGQGQAGAVIESVKTAGNQVISSVKILGVVRSRAGEIFDASLAGEDAKRIAEIKGVEYSYYSTKVVDGGIELTFVVVERNIIRSIVFEGNRKYKDKKLAKKVGLKRGEYIDSIALENGVTTLTELYRKKGYAFVEAALDESELASGKVVYRIDEGPRVRISSVKFAGNEKLKTRSLKLTVKTKKRKFFVLPRYYQQEKLAEDVLKLQRAYQKRGFLDSKIEAVRQFSEDNRKVRITFEIYEGSIYTVERVVISGNEQFDDSRLREGMKLVEGQVYSEQRATSTGKQIAKVYREAGFIDAQVERSRRFVAGDKVEIDFSVTEGERFRIGTIDITGNAATQDKVVRRILDEYDFQPGKWYNADVAYGNGSGYLEKLVRRSVLAEATTITAHGEREGQRDAYVNIIEGQTGSVMVGGGLASDSGAFAQLVFEQRNFDISDRPESWREFLTGKAFKGAGQHFRIMLQPGTEVDTFSVSFTEPYLMNKPISLDAVVSSFERDRESYDEQRAKAFLRFEKRYKSKWRRSVSVRLEDVDVDSLDIDAPQEIIDEKGSNVIVGVKLGVGRDMTNDKFNPSDGYRFNLSYEQVGGDHTFGILSAVHNRYKTLYEDLADRKTVLATKLLGATVVGNAPSFERFYGGGSGYYGIRGFDYRGVSPRGLQTGVANPERKDPVGSDWIFIASAEVTVPLVGDSLSALFFVDSGAVDSGNYRAAIGTGIQIMLPQWFGPVPMRFELAAPFMKDSEDDTQTFSFSIGRLF